jgi:hypothetical protein
MRFTYILALMLTFSNVASACDFCNCYLGLDPGYNKNTIGLRVNWRTAEWIPFESTLRTTHGTPGTGGSSSGSTLEESLITTELFVKYAPIPKLRVYMTLPYTNNTLTYEGVTESRGAFSDMTFMAMYQLANTLPHDSTAVRHRVFAGGGIKFPTGKSEGASDVEIPMADDLYSGTGSTDYIFSLSYIGKYKKLGWNFDASYKLNGESANYYKYGNSLNLTPRIFYETKIKSVQLLPHISAAYEQCNNDEYKDVEQVETDGKIFWGGAGVDVYFGIFSLTTEFRLPLYHDIGAQMAEDKSVLYTSLNIHF